MTVQRGTREWKASFSFRQKKKKKWETTFGFRSQTTVKNTTPNSYPPSCSRRIKGKCFLIHPQPLTHRCVHGDKHFFFLVPGPRSPVVFLRRASGGRDKKSASVFTNPGRIRISTTTTDLPNRELSIVAWRRGVATARSQQAISTGCGCGVGRQFGVEFRSRRP